MNIENKNDSFINNEELNNLSLKFKWYESYVIIVILLLLYPFTYFISTLIAIIPIYLRNSKLKEHNKVIEELSEKAIKFNTNFSNLEKDFSEKSELLKNLNTEISDLEKIIVDFKKNNVNELKIMENTKDIRQQLDILHEQKDDIIQKIDNLKDKYNILEKEEEGKAYSIKIKKLTLQNLDNAIHLKEDELNTIIENLNPKIENKKSELDRLSKQVIETKDEVLLQSFGLYEPKYDFENSDEYMDRLKEIRDIQKQLIKYKTGANWNVNWTVNGSIQKGNRMINNNIKLMFKLFNSECDNAMNKLSFKNIETIEKRIRKSFESSNKLNTSTGAYLNDIYLDSKINELYLYYEYLEKKKEEKEEQRELKERIREEAKAIKEIEAMKSKLEKEEKHFINELNRLKSKIPENYKYKESWINKIREIERKLFIIREDLKDVLNRELNTRAGYVYIISNIGSFGENVYKIGVTRRLDPTERVNELGSASVPFKYDIHATIFSEDAPTLEKALHKAFDKKRINKVNSRKEFFNVTLNDIKQEVEKNYNKTVEYTKVAEAMEYRQTLKIIDKEKSEKNLA